MYNYTKKCIIIKGNTVKIYILNNYTRKCIIIQIIQGNIQLYKETLL
jgi:hypothetical protein